MEGIGSVDVSSGVGRMQVHEAQVLSQPPALALLEEVHLLTDFGPLRQGQEDVRAVP